MRTAQKQDYLISIRNADVSRQGQRILHDISWQLRPGENWAIIGANGSGKSTFLKLVRGDLWPEPTRKSSRIYCLEDECQDIPLGIRKLIGMVGPELQDRYTRNGIDIAGEEVILSGFFDSLWLQESPDPSMVRTAHRLISLLQLESLKEKSILTMSRGEARKVIIARAMVFSPRVLLLDEVFNGLDRHAVKQLFGLIGKAMQSGMSLVSATHRMSDLGPFITHAVLMRDGRIFRQGRRDLVLSAHSTGTSDHRITFGAAREHAVTAPSAPTKKQSKRSSMIRMKDVSIYVDEKNILKEINWEMKSGENWAVLGKNGAGKTTFLRLISGDCRPAYGGKIRRFGRKDSVSIWDIRKKIGYVSPELQAEYDEGMTGEEVVVSGFFSSIGLYSRVTAGQRRLSSDLMRLLGIEKLRSRRTDMMSYGEFRKVLIARALVKEPALLLLDEPFSGLDSSSKKDIAGFLGRISEGSTGLIVVTHHLDEIIPSVSHVMVLEKGRIAAQGRREEVMKKDILSKLHLR